MTMTAEAFPKAFAVLFKDLTRWDPASFQGIVWHWPEEVMVPISSVLRARKEKVERSIFAFSDLQPITIHFDGSVDRRDVEADREYTMDLFFAHPGDIVVAKIDLKNGAVGIIPDDWKNAIVTGHFAVYVPDRSKLLPEYLHRIIQSRFFKAYLWRNKVGAEGRKEVKLDFFESLDIPLPVLSIQTAIVERWHMAQVKIAASKARVAALEAMTDDQFCTDLGLELPAYTQAPKVFSVWWTDFLRWSVSYNQSAQVGVDITQGHYPVVELGSLLEVIQYGTSEKANRDEVGTPILRINNIKKRFLDLSELKYIQLPQKTTEGLLLRKGDIVIIRTSGSRGLVGTCAVFNEDDDYVFASYLIRLRVYTDKADPNFISWFINSPLGRQQVDATSRQIMQSNINSEEIRRLKIPLPPLNVQRTIMKRVFEGRTAIGHEYAEVDKIANEVTAEVDALILGTQQIADVQ